MKIIQHNLIIKLFFACLLACINFQTHADASPDIWPYLKEQVFKDRIINEDQKFLKIDGPKRASSGAQVPVTIALSKNTHHIKKISVFIDANPGQHAATYFLTDQSQEILINTRIRMETDSFIRAIAETDKGELFMSAVPIRAYGGCSGYMDVHDPELTKDLGKVLLKAENNFVTTRIKHPNFTGLQKDLDSGGYIPEWIVTTIEFTSKEGKILSVENQISISQDPFLKFTLPTPLQGEITITAKDTRGNQFESAIEVN